MKDKYKIDSSKIDYHQERVMQLLEAGGDWEKQKKIYPIYVEVSPIGICNHHCTFCAKDYVGYRREWLDKDTIMRTVQEMGSLGVKSIMYAGDGEPLLYKSLSEIIIHAKDSGIDNSITTNATPLTERFVREALPYISWIKASINAGTKETYAKIHRTSEDDFDRAFGNLERAVKIRGEMNEENPCSLGSQMILLPENTHEIMDFANRSKDIGLDYTVIKPYSHNEKSLTEIYRNVNYGEYKDLGKKLEDLNSDSFQIVFRTNAMEEVDAEISYPKCLSVPFTWAYIMANGKVYGCCDYLDDEQFYLGDINEESFEEIWEGENRKKNIEFILNDFDVSQCKKSCRMNEVNKRLNQLGDMENPREELRIINQGNIPPNVNFI